MRELREIRLRRGLSQADLSAITGVTEFTISEIESGKRANPRPSTLRKLAQALEVKVADLYGDPAYRKTQAPQPSLEDAAQSDEEFQEALAVQFRRLAERGQRIVKQSRKQHGPSEALTRELHEYQAVRKALLEIKKTPSIVGHDSDELAEAEDDYLEVDRIIAEMTRQDVEATEQERGEASRFKDNNKSYKTEEPKADAS